MTADVQNEKNLQNFSRFRTQWIRLLKTDPVHSVYQQIIKMVDGDAVWRMLNETRRLAAQRKDELPEWDAAAFNVTVNRFLDEGYLATQALAIRRLLQPKQRSAHGQIISLRRVFDSIKGNSQSITREVYVCHDGKPYDYESGRRAAAEQAISSADGYIRMATTGAEAWDMAAMAHARFDRLSGVGFERRDRNDRIDNRYFSELEKSLNDPAFTVLEAYANKYVAHAADATSRAAAGGDILVSLDRIAACHAAIIRVFHALLGELLWEGTHSPVVRHRSPFQHLDKPWISTDQLPELRQWWIKHTSLMDEHVGIRRV